MTPHTSKREVRRVAIYARLSKPRKPDEDYDPEDSPSVADQLRDCRARARDQGWDCIEYIDDGRSGYSGRERPGYEGMLKAIEHHDVDAVLVRDGDRLFRRDKERLRFYETCTKAGVWLVAYSSGGQDDLSTADGQKAFRDRGSNAEYYSARLSEKLRAKHRRLAERGRDSGGMRPFAFEPDRVTVRESEAAVIREVAKRVLRGESLRSICVRLNATGGTTANGARWQPTRLRRMVTSARYAGFRELDGELIPAVWEPILDRQTFDLVGALLADPNRRTSETTARRYVLGGFVWCGACGKRLNSHGTRAGHYVYRCHTGPPHQGCGKVSIDGPGLDRYVCDAAYVRVQYLMESQFEPEPLDDHPDEIGDIDVRRRELGQLYARQEIGEIEFVTASKELRKRRSKFEAAAPSRQPHTNWTALWEKIQASKAPWEQGFDTAELDDWRNMLRLAIERVTVNPARKRGGRFNASRVVITWVPGIQERDDAARRRAEGDEPAPGSGQPTSAA